MLGGSEAFTERACGAAPSGRCQGFSGHFKAFQGSIGAVTSANKALVQDCTRSIQILDFRNKPRTGEIHHTADPEDEKVRARVEIRMGAAPSAAGPRG